jgi:hypothetical protein
VREQSFQEVMTMKVTYLLAASAAGMFALSGAVFAQDTQMTPDQTNMPQQSAQSMQSDTTPASYGGVSSTVSRAGGMAQSTWTSRSSSACVTGLSCNIYQGN